MLSGRTIHGGWAGSLQPADPLVELVLQQELTPEQVPEQVPEQEQVQVQVPEQVQEPLAKRTD